MENPGQSEDLPKEPSSLLPAATTSKPKDPITCHVLDLVSGVPAPGLSVSLTLLKPFGPSAAFKALTNADGRISSWEAPDGPSLAEIFENLHEHPEGGMVWSLKFETGKYYGMGNTFFPEVEVKFSLYYISRKLRQWLDRNEQRIFWDYLRIH
ncbi:hypothetical protein HO133_005904 [Letharia lupina]|uniref:Transthyretin/hydroxyisourate hydrolase domain-containing protein n=1 Tax=Letharia lupina TaxID=560253 RepID=A0A8H6F8I0_9LECA|nr:uncharacterized protein HO133_005904 [Letharia lupina]KAF6218554.1 hypothetical protein HO133_005904 [Letharia lupina]